MTVTVSPELTLVRRIADRARRDRHLAVEDQRLQARARQRRNARGQHAVEPLAVLFGGDPDGLGAALVMVQVTMSDDEKPLDPEAARVVAKVRRLMMIASATTFIAVAVVLGVIGYRVFRAEGRAPPFVGSSRPRCRRAPRSFRPRSANDHIVVTIEIGAGIEIRTLRRPYIEGRSAGCGSRRNLKLQTVCPFAVSIHGMLFHIHNLWSSNMAAKAPTNASPKAAPATAVPKDGIVVGKSTKFEVLDLKFGNRHGLVTGATGTGKTVTLQVLAEGFAQAGVPVFAADIKGDLSGISAAGEAKEAFVTRAQAMGLPYQPDQFSTIFWDVFGAEGHPIRATISEMGPLLLSRLLQLNDTQEGVLNIAFRVADEQGLALLDLKDLRAMLNLVAENAAELQKEYGNVSAATVGTIQRQLLVLENQGATSFFGEPALDINDFMRVDRDGRGMINILSADKLIANPRLYATFLLWMLSELFEKLPEIGDPEKPKLVFFFDEAHLLFNDAPKPLLEKIEQVVRLVRSKGVGVFFVTQNPLDVPETVLAQLGNRVQHALRAFTPRDQKAVKAAADTFRPNPKLNTAQIITELGKGEALVSFLEGNGVPSMVERTMIRAPRRGSAPSRRRSEMPRSRRARSRANTTLPWTRNRPTKSCRNEFTILAQSRRRERPGRNRRARRRRARTDRRCAGLDLRHQSSAWNAPDHRATREPALDINDFMRVDLDGRGMINILSADKLIANPRLYATFLSVDVVGIVREIAGDRRFREAEAGVLFRRGSSAVQ